jgi:hypothetical protein
MTMLRRVTSTVSLLFASIGGLLAFFYPFLLAAAGYDPGPTRGIEVPLALCRARLRLAHRARDRVR